MNFVSDYDLSSSPGRYAPVLIKWEKSKGIRRLDYSISFRSYAFMI